MSVDPRIEVNTSCELCDAFAQVRRLCPSHAIQHAIDNDDNERAYNIATDFGISWAIVSSMIREAKNRELDAAVCDLRKSVASMDRTLASVNAKAT